MAYTTLNKMVTVFINNISRIENDGEKRLCSSLDDDDDGGDSSAVRPNYSSIAQSPCAYYLL